MKGVPSVKKTGRPAVPSLFEQLAGTKLLAVFDCVVVVLCLIFFFCDRYLHGRTVSRFASVLF